MTRILATLACLPMLACTTNPNTGESEFDAVLALELVSLTGAILGDLESDPADIDDLGAGGVLVGIERFCRLDPWDQDSVRRQLDERDPTLRPYLIARYGGEDRDVCTED